MYMSVSCIFRSLVLIRAGIGVRRSAIGAMDRHVDFKTVFLREITIAIPTVRMSASPLVAHQTRRRDKDTGTLDATEIMHLIAMLQ